MMEDNSLEFNFWTAFADTMLSLVLILVLLLSLVVVAITINRVNLEQVKSRQEMMIDSIAGRYQVTRDLIDNITSRIVFFRDGEQKEIKFHNLLDRQPITFSNNILFGSDVAVLNPLGNEVLKIVGDTI